MKQIRSANWHIVIPRLQQYANATTEQLLKLKQLILQRLKHRPQDKRSSIKSEFQRGLRYYRIALEHHADGVPHLDVLLLYDRPIRRYCTDYNYLLKPAHVTTYRKLNDAIINYGAKQDKQSLNNFPEDLSAILNVQQLKQDPYRYLQLQMLKDPLHFSLQQYCRKYDLFKQLSNWSSIKVKLKDSQVAAANLALKNKPGFQLITKELIQQCLDPAEKALYYGPWDGYRRIVHYMNQIVLYKGQRDPKTLNLLITGAPNCGKSALLWHPKQKPPVPYNPLSSYCSLYPIGMSQWFPKYQSDVYHMIYWNQAKLTSYSYDTVLKLLDGSPLDLPNKGSVSRKVDNPLIIMTSNLTLEQMIRQKFGYNTSYMQLARKNLAVRVENVVVPEGYDLFLLQKLLL